MSSIGINDSQCSLRAVDGRLPLTGGSIHRRFERVVTTIEVVADLLTATFAIILAYFICEWLNWGTRLPYPPTMLACFFALGAVICVLILARDGAYRPGNSLLRIRETERVLRAAAQTFLLMFTATFLMRVPLSRRVLILAFLAMALFLIAEKQLVYVLVRGLHAKGHGVTRAVIYGAGYTGRRVFSALTRSPKLGLCPVAVVDDDPPVKEIFEQSYDRRRSVPVESGPITADLLRDYDAGMLIIAIPSLQEQEFARVVREAATAGVKLAFVPRQSMPFDLSVDYADIDGLLLGSVGQAGKQFMYEFFQRIFDLVFGSVILLAAVPVLIAIAVLVRLDSPGPALFVQIRVGLHGRLFRLFKFRTMYTDAPTYAFSPTQSTDHRITRIGRFLRRTSLDELPQILNVILGHMSLVGPRPEMPFIVEQYEPRHRQRLEVKPGITGLWQLSADRAFLIHENLQYDLYYIRNRNLFMDFAILLHTMFFAMRGV